MRRGGGGIMAYFEDLKQIVFNKFPLPIASVLNRYVCTDDNDLGGKHGLLIDLFEATTKLTCIVSLQEAMQQIPDVKDQFPKKEDSLEFLKHPSIGGYIGLLRDLSAVETGVDTPTLYWLPQISRWYLSKKTPESKEVLSFLKKIENLNFNIKSNTPNAEILNALVTYRNKHIAHGATFSNEEIAQRITILEKAIAYILHSMVFLQQMIIFYTVEAKRIQDGQEELKVIKLIGLNEQPHKFVNNTQLELSELYLSSDFDRIQQNPPINLGPFFLWISNDRSTPEVYYFNDVLRTKLEYISYTSGQHYFHKELHLSFSKIIKFEFSTHDEDYEYANLNSKEKKYKYNYYLNKSKQSVNNYRLEEGAQYLEHALNFQRTPEALLELAQTQYSLKDPPDAVIKTLESCLQIDPTNKDAKSLLIIALNDPEPLVVEEKNKNITQSYFHIFTPKPFHDYCVAWLGAILFVYYTLSVIVDISLQQSIYFIASTTTGFFCSIFWIIGFFVSNNLIKKFKYSLSMQLDSVRLDKFEEWYLKQQDYLYGNILSSEKGINLALSVKVNLKAILFLLFMFCFGWGGSMIASGSTNLQSLLMIKRGVDYFFPVLSGSICLLYTLSLIKFVYDYTKFPLKPMLTTINGEGLRSLGTLFSIILIAELSGWILYWAVGTKVFNGSIMLNVIICIACLFLVSTFSIGMPFALYFAAKEAKRKTISKFSEQIEHSFRNFMNDPTDQTYDRFEWMKKHEQAIKNISTWPLSREQTLIFVIGGNLLLFIVCVRFILIQLGLWSSFVLTFRSMI